MIFINVLPRELTGPRKTARTNFVTFYLETEETLGTSILVGTVTEVL